MKPMASPVRDSKTMNRTSEIKWHVPGSMLTAILTVLQGLFVSAFSCVKHVWEIITL